MNPDEKRVVFRDAHEPIIDRETFELVQKKRGKTKRRAPKKENGEKSIFADLLTCADCGHKLWFHVNTVNYRFAGYIDLEENYVESNFKKDTRQGVAVEYVPRAAGE
jgi:hypothetical protein